MQNRVKAIGLICPWVLMGLTGCISLARQEPAQEHYVLGGGPIADDATSSTDTTGITIGIRSARVAAYLATPFIVTRRGPSQIHPSEFHRWGEPLGEGINRMVAVLLVSRGFGSTAVAPWPAGARYDYVVQLDVVAFEGVEPQGPCPKEGGVRVLVRWEILQQLDGAVLKRGETEYRTQSWKVGDYPGLVSSLEEGLAVLADDLRASLEGLRTPRQGRYP